MSKEKKLQEFLNNNDFNVSSIDFNFILSSSLSEEALPPNFPDGIFSFYSLNVKKEFADKASKKLETHQEIIVSRLQQLNISNVLLVVKPI